MRRQGLCVYMATSICRPQSVGLQSFICLFPARPIFICLF